MGIVAYLLLAAIAIDKTHLCIIQTISIAVASPTFAAEDNNHLWAFLPLHCYGSGMLCS